MTDKERQAFCEGFVIGAAWTDHNGLKSSMDVATRMQQIWRLLGGKDAENASMSWQAEMLRSNIVETKGFKPQ